MNILNQTVVPTSKVPSWVNENCGFKPSRSTVFRWTKRGCRGRKLKTFRAGGRVCTTVEALLEFFATDDENADPVAVLPTYSESEAYLESEGI